MVIETLTPPTHVPRGSAEDYFLVEEILHYAREASLGDRVAAEFMLDAVADLLYSSDTVYVDGMAELASRKKEWGYAAVRDEELLRASLEFIASESCGEAAGARYVYELAHLLKLERSAAERLAALSSSDCRVAKHAVGLLLLVPPAEGLRLEDAA